jgi:16S rRNA (adenine1518-N6/adenine1519-N6)-dimethyltransferase
VAQRICAKAGTAAYGAFTLLCQYYAQSEILYDVPPGCFYPAPKVTSSVIRMQVRKEPPAEVKNPDLFFQVVRAAFGQRRKTLLNALSNSLPIKSDKDTIRAVFQACNLQENMRGEKLDFGEFAEISKMLGEIAVE